MVKAAINQFAPEIQAVGYRQGYNEGLREAAACKTIAEVRKMSEATVEPTVGAG